MIYPPLSDSLILPPLDDIYITVSYRKQCYEAYEKVGDKYNLIGQLAFSAFIDCLNEREIYDKWLQDVGYIPKKPKGGDER